MFRYASILTSVALAVQALGPTNIYIDTISEYSSLASCARNRLSAIVRAQSSGCGDNQQTTSFACFCYSSSNLFDTIISTAVEAQCSASDPAAQVSSALDVFASYCAQGDTYATTVFSTLMSGATPAPAATASSATMTSVPSTGTSGGSSSSLSSGAIAGIVIGVVVGVALVLAAGFLLWRRRTRQNRTFDEKDEDPRAELPQSEPQELKPEDVKEMAQPKQPPVEVGDGVRAELEAPA